MNDLEEGQEIMDGAFDTSNPADRSTTPDPNKRHARTASAFSTFAEPATPPGWTSRSSMDNDDWKPTHLRRQRSDLTGFASNKAFQPVAFKQVHNDQGEKSLVVPI